MTKARSPPRPDSSLTNALDANDASAGPTPEVEAGERVVGSSTHTWKNSKPNLAVVAEVFSPSADIPAESSGLDKVDGTDSATGGSSAVTDSGPSPKNWFSVFASKTPTKMPKPAAIAFGSSHHHVGTFVPLASLGKKQAAASGSTAKNKTKCTSASAGN